MIPYLLGAFVGSLLVMFVLSALIDRFIDRQSPPTIRASKRVGIAWLLCAVIGTWGFSEGGQIAWHIGLLYMPAALILWLYERRKLQKLWNDSMEDETFS